MIRAVSLKHKFLTLFGGGVVAQIILLLGSILLARLYDPSAFGVYGFYAGIGSLVAVVSGGRYDYLAFDSRLSDQERRHCFGAAFIALFLVVIPLLIVALIAFKNSFERRENFYFWAIGVSVSSSIFYIASQFNLVSKDYKIYSLIRSLQAVLQVTSAAVISFFLPASGLSLAFAGSQLIFGSYLFYRQLGGRDTSFFKDGFYVFKSKSAAAAINSLATFLQYSTPLAPLFFGTFYFSKAEVGAYFLYSQLFAAPLGVFRRSMLGILSSEFSDPKKALSAVKEKKNSLKKAGVWALLLVVVVAAFLVFFSEQLVVVLFGRSWVEFSYFMFPMALYFLLDAMLQPLSTLIPLWGARVLHLWVEAFRFVGVFSIGLFLIEGLGVFLNYVLIFYCFMIAVNLIELLVVVYLLRVRSGLS